MINKISFTGRETLLTSGISKAAKVERPEYVNAAKIYSKEEVQAALKKLDNAKMPKVDSAEAAYVSPFAPTGNAKAAASVDFVAETQPTMSYMA